MVRLQPSVSTESLSGSTSGDSLSTAGALSTITVQSGKAKIVLAILKHNETFQVRIRYMTPDLTDVGTTLEEAKALRQEHDELTAKLYSKQKEVAAILTRTAPTAATADGTQEVAIHPLTEAWKDVSKQMEYRKMLLDQSVAFHNSAQQFARKLEQVEESCSSEVQPQDVESARRMIQQHQDLKKGVLEASMATLQEGQQLLDRIRQAAFSAHFSTRHATTSSCYAIERLLQLLQDKWRRLDELWLKRYIQLQQCLQLGTVDQQAAKVREWLDKVGDAYIGKKDLGDSLDSAYSLQEECLTIEAQYLELPVTVSRLVNTAEYLCHCALTCDGECGAIRQRVTALQRRVDDFGKLIGVRRKNVTSSAQFFSLAQVATVKLGEIEAQLSRGDLAQNSPALAERHVYLASAIIDISTPALHSGRSLMARIGSGVPAAKGVEATLASLEERCNRLENLCSGRFDREKHSEVAGKLFDNINKASCWLSQVAEAIVSRTPEMGANVSTAQEFMELYQSLLNDLKVKVSELKAMDVRVEEMSRSTVEKDAASAKELGEKLKTLSEKFDKLQTLVDRRLKLAASHLNFQRRAQQLMSAMDQLELHLKLEKIDPAIVPDSSVKFKDETFKKMTSDWNDVESRGKQFVTEANDQTAADEKVDVQRTITTVEVLLMHLSDRKSILTEFVEAWKTFVTAGKEFKSQWHQFVTDARQTIDWIMKMEEGFFPKLAGELGSTTGDIKAQQKRLEDFKPTIVKAQEDIERLLKTAELLSLKGDTRGQRDQITNDLLKVHTRFTARIGEYRFLLNMTEKFFENLNQLDELIKTTEKQYASEEMPKEISAAQTALREHNDSKLKLQQYINFASDEADQIITRVRQQDSEAVAKDEVQKILMMAEDKRKAWEKEWLDQKKRLEQNFQVSQFYFDLKQLQDELDELQRQLDMRRGNYGSSLSSVRMIAQAFLQFVQAADGVEGRVKDFIGTADRMVRDKHFDSRRIRHEVDETERRWKTFYNSIKNYEIALADSTKFFENWDACEGWINDAAQFLLGISREAPSCQTSEDVDRLIKKIETYRMEGYKDQDGRLNGMEKIVTDLYGQVAGPEKLQPLLDKNQEMFNAFVRAVEELAILRNNLNKTEQILASVGAVIEQKAPRQPRFVQPLQNAEIADGHGFVLECRLECDTTTPLIEWFKDGQPMTRGTTDFKDGLCRLTIDIVNPADSATYTCKATTSAGTVETTANIKVKETQQKIVVPQMTKQLRNADAPEGTSLTLECYLSGIPFPTVSWFKDGVCIDNNPEYVITLGSNSEPCTLKIRRLDKARHSGVYMVKATNPGGEVSSSATVNVLSVQKPEFTEPLKDVTVNEGKGLRLEVKYVGEPAPQIQWLCNDVQILPSAMFKITVDVGITTLEIREVFAEDCGIYSVVAKNLGGEARTSGRVGLTETTQVDAAAIRAGARRPVKPLFVEPLENKDVLEGSRTKLECVITGYPEPEITWLHNERPVKKTKDIDILYDNGRCTLLIHEVYLEDSGEYVCIGKNEHGSGRTSCRLIVEPLSELSDASASATGDVPPKFTQLLKDIEGTEGELVRFECRVIGHPTPTIKWFRGRNQIENSPEFQILSERELQALTIPAVFREDAGNYMVKANNDAGQAKCYATLIVKPASDRHAMKMRLIESCHSVQTNIIEGCTAPEITRSFRDLHVRPGDPCTMEVVIEGKPKPKVHWLFNNELIKDYQMTSFGDVYSLHIPAVADKDAGRFSVIAENAAGKAWCSALLVVVEVSQMMPDEGSPPQTPLGDFIQPVVGPMPLFAKKPAAAPAPPRFDEPLKSYTVDEGEQVTLECQVSGQPEPVVRWYKEGRPLTANQKIEMRKQEGKVRLILYQLNERDSGRYTCIATNTMGENSTSSNLIVNAIATPPTFTETPQSQRVREGQSVRFSARVAGIPPPEVTWYREGVLITSSPDFSITSHGDVHVLDITEVFYEDAGRFSVQASNAAGKVQSVADLVVEPIAKVEPVTTKPQFTRPLQNQSAKVGQRITLECAIPPYPEPDQVRWYRNEIFLELSPDYQPAYRDGICSLTIPYVSPEHAGKYSCVVVLRGVPNSTDMHLEVRPDYDSEAAAAQQPQFDGQLRSVRVLPDQDAVFVCHLTGHPPPNIHWYHNDRLIRPSRRYEMKLTRDGECSLRIKSVTPEDAGQYTCTATNMAGQGSSSGQLEVEGDVPVDESSYVSPDALRRLMASPGKFREGELGGVSEQYFKPVFRKVPADLEVSEGQLARFDCVVSGRPIPDMLWYRDGVQVHPDPIHKIVINEEGISSLIIDSTRAADSGLYTCIARNRAGEDRFQVRLNILPRQLTSPPRFLSRLTNQTVSTGQSVTFEADVSGVPIPLLSWQKDGCHIAGSDHYQVRTEGTRSMLYIQNVGPEDDAWYQCTAASVSGIATNRVRLIVQVDARHTPIYTPPVPDTRRSNVNLLLSPTPPPPRTVSPSRQQTDYSSREIISRKQTTVTAAPIQMEVSGVPAPKLIEPMRDQHLNDGSMAHFWCKIYSSSPPTCEWFHNNRPIYLSEKYRIANNPAQGDYALMVFDVHASDAGVYKCVVSNPGGEVTCIAHLHIESAGRLGRVEHTAETRPSASPRPQQFQQPQQQQQTTMSVQRTVMESSYSSQQTLQSQQFSRQQEIPSVIAAPPTEPPRFTRKLENITTVDGAEVTLSCIVTARPTPTVSWFHNGRNIDASTDFAIGFDEQTGRADLVIVDCMPDDRGQFRCVAVNPAGRAESECTLTVMPSTQHPVPAAAADLDMSEEFKTASAQFAVVPASGSDVVDSSFAGTAPRFIEPIQPCVVVEGDQCTFRAHVIGDPCPEITWLKEKQDLVLTSRHQVKYDERTGSCSLQIVSCGQSDTGVYSCRASNPGGRATCTANVVVVPPNVEVTVTEKTTSVKKEKVTTIGDQELRVVENSPTFTHTLLPVTEVNEGDNVRLECSFSAEPSPSVSWRLNGVELAANNRLTMTANASQSTLSIHGVTMADTGEYVCVATNSLGEANTRTFLRVRRLEVDTVSPVPSSFPPMSDVSSQPPLFSRPVGAGSALEASFPLMATLPVNEPCTIISASEQPLPPKFTLSLHNQTVLSGSRAEFVVLVEGQPPPRLTWYVNGTPVEDCGLSEIVVELERGRSSKLTVVETSSSSEGEYMCKAENSCGTAFTNSHLFVVSRTPEMRRSVDNTEHTYTSYSTSTTQQITTSESHAQQQKQDTIVRSELDVLFSRKIAAEKPVPLLRTDSSRTLLTCNVFVPIPVIETLGYCTDEEAHIYEKNFDRMCAPVPHKGDVFSETVAIDTGDHRAISMQLNKLKKISTLDVHQNAMPQGYRVEAEIKPPPVPQTFSETLAIDTADRRPVEVELIKLRTSEMNVERKALPKGVRVEAEVLEPSPKMTRIYVARTKLIEALQSHREEFSMLLEGGRPPIFEVPLQSQQTMNGGNVQLTCRVRGDPMPVYVEWSHSGKPVHVETPGFKPRYDLETGDATLLIGDVFPEDAGIYECVASNIHGEARTKAELIVEEYEYISDASPSRATSTCFSSLQSIPSETSVDNSKTVAEAMVEEAFPVEAGYEDAIQVADVKWCLPSFIEPTATELAEQFTPGKIDLAHGWKLVAEYRGVNLATSTVSSKKQALVEPQVTSFREEQLSLPGLETANTVTQEIVVMNLDKPEVKRAGQMFTRVEQLPDVFADGRDLQVLKAVVGEDRAREQVTSPLEKTPQRQHPASWTFPQVSIEDHERTGDMVDQRAPSPKTAVEQMVDYILNKTSAQRTQVRAGFVDEYHSEGEDHEIYHDAPEPAVPAKQVAAIEFQRAAVNNRHWTLVQLQKICAEIESIQTGVDAAADGAVPAAQPTEVPSLFGLAVRFLPAPTRAAVQLALTEAFSAAELNVEKPSAEVGRPSVVTADLERARVEAGKASLVKFTFEINKYDGFHELPADKINVSGESAAPTVISYYYEAPCMKQKTPMHTRVAFTRLSPEKTTEREEKALEELAERAPELETIVIQLERSSIEIPRYTRVEVVADNTECEKEDESGVASLESFVDSPLVTEPQAVDLDTCVKGGQLAARVDAVVDETAYENLSVEAGVESLEKFTDSPLVSEPEVADLESCTVGGRPVARVEVAADVVACEKTDDDAVQTLENVMESPLVSEPEVANLQTCMTEGQLVAMVDAVVDGTACESLSIEADVESLEKFTDSPLVSEPEVADLESCTVGGRPVARVEVAADVVACEKTDDDAVQTLEKFIESALVSEPEVANLQTCVTAGQLAAMVDFVLDETAIENLNEGGVENVEKFAEVPLVSEPIVSELENYASGPQQVALAAPVEDRNSPERLVEGMVADITSLETVLSAVEMEAAELSTSQLLLPAVFQVTTADEHRPSEDVHDFVVPEDEASPLTSASTEVPEELVSTSKADKPMVQALAQDAPSESEETDGRVSPTCDVSVAPVDVEIQLLQAQKTEVQLEEPIHGELIKDLQQEQEYPDGISWPEEKNSDDFIAEEENAPEKTDDVEIVEEMLTYTDIEDSLLKTKVTSCDVRYWEDEMIYPTKVKDQRRERPPEYDWMGGDDTSPFEVEEVNPVEKTKAEEDVQLESIVPEVVESPFGKVEAKECDVYMYEEEHYDVEVVCDMKMLMMALQDADKAVAEEQVLPEAVVPEEVDEWAISPSSVEEVSLGHVDSSECDVLFYDEETFAVEVVCELKQQLLEQQRQEFEERSGDFSIVERVSPETVQEVEPERDSKQPEEIWSDILPQFARHARGSETFVLPQIIVHRVEATSRLSPTPSVASAVSPTDVERPLDSAKVDECTIFSQEEETFHEAFSEERTAFEEVIEAEAGRQLQATTVGGGLRAKKHGSESEMYSSGEEMYSSGEELFESWTVDERREYEEKKKLENELSLRERTVITAVEADFAPTFRQPLYNVKVHDGSTATMECRVAGRPTPDIKWFVDGTEIRASTDFLLSHVSERCSLVINDVLPEDEGEYSVVATNLLGTNSSSAYLTVLAQSPKPDDAEMYSSGEEMFSSGEEVTTGWTVENQKVFEEFKKLEIDVSLKRHEVLAASTESQQLEVSQTAEAPVFTKQLESLDVFESTPVRLECCVKGFPQPDIVWYQDGNKIVPDEHMKLDYSNGRCTLMIDRVSIEDEAAYVCEARNKYGTVSTWAELLVEKLIEGLEQLVVEEFYEVEIEMNFKWKSRQNTASPKTHADVASIC